MPTKPLVIVTRKLPDVIETRMMELFDVRLNLDDRPLTQTQLVDAMRSAVVLVPNFGTGVDHIDLKTARQRNITVTNTPGVLTEDTADMTMALILALPRRLTEGERLLRSNTW